MEIGEIYGLSYAQVGDDPEPTGQGSDRATEESNNHLALIYEDFDEQFSAVVPFIRQGLERGEQCLYVIDDNTKPAVLDELRCSEIDVDSAIESGDLVVLTADETYLRTGSFDTDSMLEFWQDSLVDARDENDYTGLRAAAEMTWALEGGADVDDVATYESELNDLYTGDDYVVLCQYNRERFPAAVLSDVLNTHPLVVYEENVVPNSYYSASDEFSDSDQPELDIGQAISELFDSETSEQTQTRYTEKEVRGDPRILPLINDAGNRRVIVDWLAEQYEVVASDEASEPLPAEAFDLCILDPGSFDKHRDALIDYKESQEPRILPYLLLRREGSPLLDEDAKQYIDDVIVMPTTGRELEQRLESVLRLRQLSQELKEKNEELQQKNEQLQYLVDAAAHDLRNPLNIAKGHLELLGDNDSVATIRQALDRMEHLVENLLSINRTDQEVPEDTLEFVDLTSIVSESWEVVATRNAEMEITLSEEYPIQANPSLLRQLVENLIRNAIDHGGDDVTIEIGLLPSTEGFYLSDDGPGIPEQARESVFDQGYSTNAGYGLGLTIGKRAADIHSWDIRVTDSKFGGARFEISNVDIIESVKRNAPDAEYEEIDE